MDGIEERYTQDTSTNWSYPLKKELKSYRTTDRHSADTVLLSFRLPAELHANFSALCRRKGISNSNILRNLMAAFLEAAAND